MAEFVLVLGSSGSGKSSSTRSLDYNETFVFQPNNKIIDMDELIEHKAGVDNGNFMTVSDIELLPQRLTWIGKNKPSVKTLIIDDFNYYQQLDFLNRIDDVTKGGNTFEKFNLLALAVHKVMNAIKELRKDMIVILMSHSMTGEDGKLVTKSVGKLTEGTIAIDGMTNWLLHSSISEGKHIFKTRSKNSLDCAKTPRRCKLDDVIDNDLRVVVDEIRRMRGEEISTYVSEEHKELLSKSK